MALDTLDQMRAAWEDYARTQAMQAIACWRSDWTPEDFFASGEEDLRRTAKPFWRLSGFDPAGKRALELGCGVGRMTRALARRFAEVHAADISPTMLEKGQALLAGEPGIVWQLLDGHSLAPYADNFFDFVFSFIVLQHVPAAEISLNYLREIGRVLRPGGLFLVQLSGYAAWRVPGTTFWVVAGLAARRWYAQGRRPFLPSLWVRKFDIVFGAPVSMGQVRRTLAAAKLEPLKISGRWSQHLWVGGRKKID